MGLFKLWEAYESTEWAFVYVTYGILPCELDVIFFFHGMLVGPIQIVFSLL